MRLFRGKRKKAEIKKTSTNYSGSRYNITEVVITITDNMEVLILGSENIALSEAVYYILLSLYSPLLGYAIMQKTTELFSGRISLPAGTYTARLTHS